MFEVAKTANGYASAPTTLVSFDETHQQPYASLIADANGNLFGTTLGMNTVGNNVFGTVFEVAKTAGTPTGYASIPTTLVSFNVTNGATPEAGLIADANGNLFGTTAGGGNSTRIYGGTVFEIIGSGFVAFVGTPGKPNCHGQSVSALSRHTVFRWPQNLRPLSLIRWSGYSQCGVGRGGAATYGKATPVKPGGSAFATELPRSYSPAAKARIRQTPRGHRPFAPSRHGAAHSRRKRAPGHDHFGVHAPAPSPCARQSRTRAAGGAIVRALVFAAVVTLAPAATHVAERDPSWSAQARAEMRKQKNGRAEIVVSDLGP